MELTAVRHGAGQSTAHIISTQSHALLNLPSRHRRVATLMLVAFHTIPYPKRWSAAWCQRLAPDVSLQNGARWLESCCAL